MGIFHSKPKMISIKFFRKDEIQEFTSLGFSPHPDKSLNDIIFVPQGITKVMALDEINTFMFKDGRWRGTNHLVMNSLSSIENYIRKYCEKKEIKVKDKVENVYIIKN